MKNKKTTKNIAISAVCLALCYVLPFLTANNQLLGNALCLMHLPVFLCGFICGAPYGALVGIIAPLLRSLTLGMPPIIIAISMAAELCVYGLASGLINSKLPRKPGFIYLSLICAMLLGRLAGGASKLVLLALGRLESYSIGVFFSAYFVTALPGIILQIVLVPALVMALRKTKLDA